MRLRSLFLSALILVLPLPLLADTVYSYTGNPFTTYYGSPTQFTAADFVSGSFTVATPLADNLSSQLISPTSFSFSNGIDTLSSADLNVNDAVFNVVTDSTGAIDQWIVYIQTSTVSLYTHQLGSGSYDGGLAGAGSSNVEQGVVDNDPGTWTETSTTDPSAVPEPNTLALLSSGVLGLVGMVRRRFMA